MAKVVDALVSGTSVSNDVQVRVLFWALKETAPGNTGGSFFLVYDHLSVREASTHIDCFTYEYRRHGEPVFTPEKGYLIQELQNIFVLLNNC